MFVQDNVVIQVSSGFFWLDQVKSGHLRLSQVVSC
jgi:hypothetical protein